MKITTFSVSILIMFFLATGITLAADNFHITARGAQYKELKTGAGETAQAGDIATMHFTGWLDDNGGQGKELYNSRKEGRPVSFVVGTDKIMQGWNEGVIGMKKGGKRLLRVPPALGYGAKSVQDVVPANTSLLFVIELVDLEKAK
ncbi:MAG: FKBP-type peptidyl-prolyl cis-trans isomerase [Gammaproteobacteria bacterium]